MGTKKNEERKRVMGPTNIAVLIPLSLALMPPAALLAATGDGTVEHKCQVNWTHFCHGYTTEESINNNTFGIFSYIFRSFSR